MIIFGTRAVTLALYWIMLWCPRCEEGTETVVIQRRRWFTLFFIPVIPFHGKKNVLCSQCELQRPLAQVEAEANDMMAGLEHQEPAA